MGQGLDIRIRAETDPPFLHPLPAASLHFPISPFPAPIRLQMLQRANLTQMLENRALPSPHFALVLNSRFPDYARFSSLKRAGETLFLERDSKDRISLP